MTLKFIRHIGYTKQIKIFVTSLFIFSFTYAKAQTTSYTEPSSYDLQLANKAVSSCRVLQDVISKNSQVEDIPAIEAFIELQKTEDGDLLIDDPSCRESILEFVKSLCTSSSSKNNLYCESLGVQKSSDNRDNEVNDTRDYKKFGQSAIDNLGIDLSDDISFESSLDEKDQREESKLKFLAAGTLFSLSPVKKLRVASFVGKNLAIRIKPVLNGALLVLATLGLSSCNDATGPEPVKPPTVVDTPCTRRESGYFQLSGANGACIKLPSLTYSFVADDGTESDSSNGDPDTTIRIKFDSEVVFIDNNEWQELTPENVLQMLEIKKNNTETDLTTPEGSINQDNISITTESSNTVITIKPPNSSNGKIYHAGEYSMLTKNYAPKTDASKVQQSTNINTYLESIKEESSFSVTGNNPCVRGETGYFYFRDSNNMARCENLIPNISYTFSKNNDPQAILNISFDSDVVYIDNNGWSEIDNNNILDMLAINPVDTGTDVDYTIYTGDLLVEDGPIDQEQITVTKTNTGITIEIDPPNTGLHWRKVHKIGLYQAGNYMLSASNYIRRSDIDIVIQNNALDDYLDAAKGSSGTEFSIDAVSNLSCGSETFQGYMPTTSIEDEHQEPSFCGAYVHELPPELAIAAHHHYQPRRADPNTTYVIDIGFVMSERYSTPGWDDFITNHVLTHVNDIYQRSGVNVEFRAKSVVPFQDYRHYIRCQIDALDLNNRYAISRVNFDLISIIRKNHGVDLIYTIQNFEEETRIAGFASVRFNDHSLEEARIYATSGTVDPGSHNKEIPDMFDQQYRFIHVLTHELGHNLGLLHNKEDYETFPVESIFHPKGYGYIGSANAIDGQALRYGTVMSIRIDDVPFFSANKVVTKEELCIDEDRYDNKLGGGFCTASYDKLADEQLRLGDEQADASEALQYTIEDASKYHCGSGSC